MMKFLSVLMILMMLFSGCLAEGVQEGAEPAADEEASADAASADKLLGLIDMEQLIRAVIPALEVRDYTLEVKFSDEAANRSFRVSRLSENSILIQAFYRDSEIMRLEIDPQGVRLEQLGYQAELSYEELLNMALELPADLTDQPTGAALWTEEDHALLNRIACMVSRELEQAGLLPSIRQYGDGASVSLSVNPAAIGSAIRRFAGGLAKYEAQIDALLGRWSGVLRTAVPGIFATEYNEETGEYHTAEAIGYTDLYGMLIRLQNLICYNWTRESGAHAQLNLDSDEDGWACDASVFLPYEEVSLLLSLEGDGSGFEGELRLPDSIEEEWIVIRAEGELTGSGLRLRLLPDRPMEGFTGLLADIASDRWGGFTASLTTDYGALRINTDHGFTDLTLTAGPYSLDAHFTLQSGYPQGVLSYEEPYGYLDVKLNQE